MKKLSKKIISIFLALVMAMPAVMAAPFAAEAEDAPSSAYWSILASTDFTKTSWSGSGEWHSTSSSPTTAAGGNPIGWGVRYGAKSSDEVLVNSKGVNFDWIDDNNKHQGLLYMSSYNGQTNNTIFNGISNFKIDLAFSFISKAKCNGGYDLKDKANDVPLIKLPRDSSNKYSHRSQYNHQTNYFIQSMWGERSVDDDDYYVNGGTTETEGTTTGGKWAITTKDNNSSSVIDKNTTYHYIVYVADKMLGSYVTDDSGNVVINYNPIELGSYSFTPADISSIYLGASEFNWAGKYDAENIAYKSIEIYKGVDSSSYDNSRNKFLYAYFTGDSDAGETMHYAISQDGINFEAVSGGAQVWNPSTNGATETYPAADSAPYSDSVAISNHVRDSYAFIGQDGKDYVIATDLNTNNGNWGNIQNSRFLLWKMDFFGDINDTRPISIDTAKLPGMDDVTGATSSSHKTIKKAWAPQVIWDADVGKYMLYWSVGADGISTQVYYTYTSDFKTDFTPVKRLLYPDFAGSGITNHIDADITYHNGLYYCYFKNEDGSGTGSKRIWYAVAPNANGPYTDYELVSTSYGAEGPQVYETGNGSYMLMIDGYGNHTYHMYSSGTPYYFDTANETSTNVSSLTPRHGSIIRITDAEYQKLKKLRIGSEVRYTWENVVENYTTNAGTLTDSGGHSFTRTYYTNALSTGNGVLTLNNTAIYISDTTVKNYIASDVYTVTFYYKNTSSSALSNNNSVFAISNDDTHENANYGTITSRRYNYVRLSEDGVFYVNGTAVTPSGNCSDGTTARATKLSSSVADKSASHRYTVTSDGLITSLIIDGEFICGVLNDTDIPNSIWVNFGWARLTDNEDYRLTAQFGQIVFKNVATETGAQDELFNEIKPSSVPTSASFSKTAYHRSVQAGSDYYQNLVYCSGGPSPADQFHSGNAGNTNFTDEKSDDHLRFKFATAANAVGVYDGTTHPSYPIIAETYMKSQASSEIMHFIQPYANSTDSWNARPIDLRYSTWTGYGTNWEAWPSSNSNSFAAEAASQYNHTNFNAKGDQNDAKGKGGVEASAIRSGDEHRFWKNSIQHRGNGADENSDYLETFSNPNFLVGHSSKGGGNRYFYYFSWTANTNFYVINYTPVKQILDGSVKVPGTTLTVEQFYNNDATNRWMYTKESYTQALYAIKMLNDCNPNNYNYNSNPGSMAAQCGKDIKKAVEAFNNINLVKNQFNITYRMADGTTKAELVTAGNTLTSVPSNTADFHIADSFTHKKNCTWSSYSAEAVPSGSSAYVLDATPVNGEMPMANTVFVETGTVEDCNDDGAEAYTEPTEDYNGYTDHPCSVCGNVNMDEREWDAQDWETYNDNLDEFDSIVEDGSYASTYTPTSRTNYENLVATKLLSNTDITIPQSKITSYAGAILSAKTSVLDRIADLSALDAAKVSALSQAGSSAITSAYTSSSVSGAVSFLNSASEFPIEHAENRSEIGVSQNSAITNEISKYVDWQTQYGLLDPVADLTKFDKAYDKGDSILKNLVGKTAQYDKDSVEALVDELEKTKVQSYASASAETRADLSKASVQTEIEGLAKDINDAIEGLKLAEIIDATTGNAVDTSAFEAAVNTINNLDPDAYEEDELHSLANAKDTINDYYGTAKVEYGDDYINVVNGITTQAKAEEATCVILGALNSCIKRYAVTRNGFSNYGIKNGTEKNGEINYGATLTCDSGSAETAWFIEIETSSMHKYLAFQKYGRELETKILGRTVVNAVKRDATNNCRIMITRSYGDERAPVQYANFVANGTEFELPSAPSVAYYHFEGYKYKNGANINTSTITINGDTEIVAVYSQNNTLSCSVNAKDIKEKTIPTDSVAYNEKVVLDGGEGTYGWLEKIGTTYRPFYIGRKVSFFATESIVLEAVDEETFNSYGSIPCVNLRQSGVVTADSKKVFDAQLVPGDADVREYGILIAAPSSKGGAEARTPLDSEIIIENSGQQAGYAILRAKSTKLVGANQFSIVVSGALPEGYKYRGYVIYQYKGSLKTVYSDIMQ